MDEAMQKIRRPHTTMPMKQTSLYLPQGLVDKAKQHGVNLSAIAERALHEYFRDRISLDGWKELAWKQVDIVAAEVNKDPQQKPDVLMELAKLRSMINRLEGTAYVKVEEK